MSPPKKEQEKPRDNQDPGNTEKLRQFLELLNLQAQQNRDKQQQIPAEHKFWKTQPVPQGELNKEVKPGTIEGDKPENLIRKDPYPLPSEFEWCLINVDDEAELKDLYELLNLNYGEDHDEMFRFDYSPEFLRWALQPPGWKEQWHVGIRVAASKKLVAFISAIPMTIFAVDKTMPMVEINFLCVHKKLRNKRFSPVLIKEITRRVHLTGIFQAVYTAGITIPTPIATCPYHHRPLNFPKLVDIKFSYIPKDSTMEQEIEKYKLPDTPTLALRPMEEKDIDQVHDLFNEFNSQFKLGPVFDSKETTRHWHMPLDKVNYSFVVEDENGKIQDFISFYQLNSSVLFHEEHQTLNIAYLNYYCTRRFNATKGPEGQSEEEKVQYKAHITELIKNLLIVANKEKFDVFNCVENLHAAEFLKDLEFRKGDGVLNYYLFNYKTPSLSTKEIGLIML